MNYIQYGNSFFHGNSARYGTDGLLMSGRCEQVIALFGNELAADTLTFVVNSKYLTSPSGGYAFLLDSDLRPLKSSDGKWLLVRAIYPDWRTFTAGAPLELYNQQGGQVIGRFFVQNVRQISRKFVEFTCTDCVGMIAALADHNGGIYNGTTIGEIIDDIMSGSGIAYTVSQEVREVAAYGRLPRDNRRTNLAKVLVATGATLTEDTMGRMVISYLGAGYAQNIPQRVIYLNTGSVEYKHPATAVQVTEHAFYQLADDEQTTLFDNTNEIASTTTQLVVFDEPCYNLTTTGTLTITESNENYAVVEGNGTLVGTVYTHTKRVITESTGVVAAQNVLKLEDNELVGIHNSDYVAKRMSNYYKLAIGVQFDAYDETGLISAGTKLNIVDPFGVARTGWLEKKSFNLGNKTKAQMEIAVDWVAGPWGSNIDQSDLVLESGTWTVPAGVDTLTVVLGSAGEGGQAGFDGTAGGDGVLGGDTTAGEGGEVGAGGNAGKVYQVTIPVSAGDIVTVNIGAAGEGGAENGAEGSAGGATTITVNGVTYTSESGTIPERGFTNQFTGDTYALPAPNGDYKGADGGVINQYKWWDGSDLVAGDVTYTGGKNGKTKTWYSSSEYKWICGGGGGSGAAYGNNGNNGEDGTATSSTRKGGNGAKGADALPPTFTPLLGGGGKGGNGGGGGGGGGVVAIERTSGSTSTNYTLGKGGAAGKGGAGGKGSRGCDGGQGWCLFLYSAA